MGKEKLHDWEISMVSALRVAMNESKYDVLNLYLKLEQASKEYLRTGSMKEGDSFTIPLEDGSYLQQFFYKKHSTLDLINPDKTVMPAIRHESSVGKEYEFLQGYTQAIKNRKMGIGPRYPEEMKQFIEKIKPGQVLVFSNGKSFVCEKNEYGSAVLVQTSGNTKSPHISNFETSKRWVVESGNYTSMQNFYSAIRDLYGDEIQCRVSTNHRAQELINKVYAGIDKKTRKVQIGPNSFRVKKSILSKEMKWYNEKGKEVPEERIKVLLGWLDAAPTIMEFERDESTAKTEFDDNVVRTEVNRLLNQTEFEKAALLMEEYCLSNDSEMSINIKSYVADGQSFDGVSFVFTKDKDVCRIFRVKYKDNDVEKDPVSMEEIELEAFLDFCKAKYNENFLFIENNIREEILKSYPNYVNDFFHQMVEVTARREALQAEIMPVEIENVRTDVSNLAHSYKKEGRNEEEHEY